MGRHAAPQPAPRRSTPSVMPGRRATTVTAGALLVLSAASLTVLTLAVVLLSGVSLLPRQDAAAVPAPSATPTVSRVAIVTTPAQEVVDATRATTIPGWRPASAPAWTGGTPFDSGCGRPTPDAALAANRIYDAPGGQVVVTVSAYSAGAGAVAFHDWSAHLATCASAPVSASVVTSPGTDAVVATLGPTAGRPGASVLLWRRGDVIASVAIPHVVPTGLAALAASVDAALLRALSGRCATVASSLADAARSPWIASATFTGLTAPVTITVTPSPTPAAPAGVTPVPDGFVPSPLPSISYPVRPADPVWPLELPTPVGSPVEPPPPPTPTTASVVPSRLDDPVGPGCGWAFAGQVPPPFDAAAEASLAQARAEQAQAELVIRQQTWQSDLVSYWEQQPVYEQQALAFAAYATAVNQVALAWDTITRQREDYVAALATYDAAAAARTQFFLDQAAAQATYDAALLACGPLPTDTATATATPSVSTSPTVSVTPTPSDTLLPVCPPEMPPILLEQPPTLPPIPAPPPDPRPSAS